MNRIIAILLLIAFAFDFGGVMVLFKVQQLHIRREIKRQIKRGLSEDELIVIAVDAKNEDDLQWKNDHEFVYDGNMYDIVRSEVRDGSVVYHCINDIREKELFSNLDELVRKKADQQGPANRVALKLFKLFSLGCYFVNEVDRLLLVIHDHRADRYMNHYSSPFLFLLSPPPWGGALMA